MTRIRWNSITRRSTGVLLAAILLVVGATSHRVLAQSATIRLVVDYGDGVIKTINGLPWSKGSTVLDVMNAAKVRPHGIAFKNIGSGATSFLTQIDDVQNECGGSGKKNWQFWVNTTYADKSFGVYEVQAYDVVFWQFATYQGK